MDSAIDEKKRKRMESNRESARRSRQKKQQRVGDLLTQASELRKQNDDLADKIAQIGNGLAAAAAAAAALRAEKERLARRLKVLERIADTDAEVEVSNRAVRESGAFSDSDTVGCDSGMVKQPWRLSLQFPCR